MPKFIESRELIRKKKTEKEQPDLGGKQNPYVILDVR